MDNWCYGTLHAFAKWQTTILADALRALTGAGKLRKIEKVELRVSSRCGRGRFCRLVFDPLCCLQDLRLDFFGGAFQGFGLILTVRFHSRRRIVAAHLRKRILCGRVMREESAAGPAKCEKVHVGNARLFRRFF
jgi:hypothetical protein